MLRRLVLVGLLLIPVALWAHTPLLVVEDNEDGTIFIEAGFSNGASAAGTAIILRSKATDEVLWEGKMVEEGAMDIPMPSEPYTVTLNAGPGHVVTKDGPEPAGGFGGAAPAAEPEASPAPAPAAQTAAADSSQTVWTPAATMGAVPPSPASPIEIVRVVLAALQILVLGYLVIVIKRSKQ